MIVGNKISKAVGGAGVVQVAGPNSRRVGVIIPSVSTSKAFFSFGDQPGPDDGLAIQSGTMAPFLLLFDSPNDYITQPIFAHCLAALNLSIVELVDREP